MSNVNNDNILESAREVAEEYTNHPSRVDERLVEAANNKDFDTINLILAEIAQSEIHNSNAVEFPDVY
jgi:hypothetical protein